jgi:16S rRNA (cytosine967-C5)-methyltransferase
LTSALSPARKAAYEVLLRVAQGGYAPDLLREIPLEARDAGLASEIVLGSLRRRAQLDFLIAHYSGQSPQRLDEEVLAALRMGLYQLRCLDRVPPHAAVGESVELVKRAGKRAAAGFVNAVLRKVTRDPIPWPDRAVELSLPAWLLDRWDRHYGSQTAEKIARAFLEQPETYVRITGGTHRIQDIGSQSIVPLLELRAGQTFLDLCAAPGNKTAQALESGVRGVACDVNWERLRGLRSLPCDLVVLDGTAPLPLARKFDRILVDAPCSGTGTLGRNPEIKWRVQSGDPARFRARQVRLVRHALEVLAAGGRLVYSTCSLEPEENDEVVEEALGTAPGRWRVAGLLRRLPGVVPGDGFFAAVITSDEPTNA